MKKQKKKKDFGMKELVASADKVMQMRIKKNTAAKPRN